MATQVKKTEAYVKQKHPLKPLKERLIILAGVVIPIIISLVVVVLWIKGVGAAGPLILLLMAPFPIFGIGIGYHRLLTHESFETYPIIRFFFAVAGCVGIEGPPTKWVGRHRKHHKFSDKFQDPHSPIDGFWHAHIGCVFCLDFDADPKVYCKKLLEDTLIRFVDRTYWLWVFVSFLIPFGLGALFIGGWAGALIGLGWGGFARMVLAHHITASVNSVEHTFGKREYDTPDKSRNEAIVAILAGGEWHNTHHAFPWSAYHGLEWWQIDLSGYLISALGLLHLAWKIKRPSEEQKQEKRIKTTTP